MRSREKIELLAQLNALKKQGKAILSSYEDAITAVELMEDKIIRLNLKIEQIEQENYELLQMLRRKST